VTEARPAWRWWTALIGAFVIVFGLTSGPAVAGALDDILAAGVVRIAVPQDLPPFGAKASDGNLHGYDIEVARLLAKELGVRLKLVPVTSVNRVTSLLTHDADLVVANLGITPDRAKAIAFSSPYAPFFSAVFGAPGLAVSGPADLAGKKVAVTRDTVEDHELTRMAPKGTEILRFDNNGATLDAVLSNHADLLATGNVVVASVVRQHPDKPLVAKFRIAESPPGIGVPRDEPDLLNWVNVFVYHSKLNGDLDRLSRQWLGEPLPPLPVL
jgi:polar amino acid transport system substrate-binding protein